MAADARAVPAAGALAGGAADARAPDARGGGAEGRGRRAPGWWRRRSLRFRLTAAASAVLALALAMSAWVLVGVLGRSLTETIDESAFQRANQVRADADAGRLPRELTNTDGTMIQVLDAGGRITHATVGTDRLVPLLGPQARAEAVRSDRARFLDGRPHGIPARLRVLAVSADGGQTVIAARSYAEVEQSLGAARHVLVLGTPILIVLLAGASWMIIGGTLRPIAALRRGATEITGTARARRLPVPEARDEVHSLATTLNDMLARLEAAETRQRALVADAAHELRSPLASIRLQLEVALGHPEGQDWRETAEGVLEDTMRLSRLAEALLALARLDERGGRPARREPVDLCELVRSGVERYAENPVPVVAAVHPGAESIRVAGDALDLSRVLTNLIDNAVRHTATSVTVELHAEDGGAVLAVRDDGPGIPEADRERVFDRFTRLDSARSRDEGGAGLGLAIVRETVRAHGGTVSLEDAEPGLRAVVRLPADNSDESLAGACPSSD
ncbi:signal transduction histidine kinase [Thermocatellispora tengchongensis]|uniref:histidine kinase n=1 Tax=Thermocatellispora tengchongensis TaxID=1073253 RepID=A0A840P7U4_9ACTN|nr:ATP-binding protein [Thermocatellispora tengchongensis]MBB5132085.1 signal transduction histidine kinase [Thermocatellispora tengchongensis]